MAVRLLVVGQELSEMDALAPLHRALTDELDNVRQRVFYLLTYLVDRPAILQTAEQLKSGSGTQQALAVETLDVMLPGNLKNMVLPLVDPGLTIEQQAQRLGNIFPFPGLDNETRLTEIIMDGKGAWGHHLLAVDSR